MLAELRSNLQLVSAVILHYNATTLDAVVLGSGYTLCVYFYYPTESEINAKTFQYF